MSVSWVAAEAGLLLRGEPFLDARSAIKNLATEVRPWRPCAKHVPAIERPWVLTELGGEFFFGQKFRKDRTFETDIMISCASSRAQRHHIRRNLSRKQFV